MGNRFDRGVSQNPEQSNAAYKVEDARSTTIIVKTKTHGDVFLSGRAAKRFMKANQGERRLPNRMPTTTGWK